MYKYFLAGLYSVSLLLLLCVSGCYVADAVFTTHHPQNNIICDKSWEIPIDIQIVPHQLGERYIKKCKDITIHIRNSSDSNFISVPMVVESADLKIGKMQLKAIMKPIPCDASIEHVEYYMDYMIGYKYYRIGCYRVPVSK